MADLKLRKMLGLSRGVDWIGNSTLVLSKLEEMQEQILRSKIGREIDRKNILARLSLLESFLGVEFKTEDDTLPKYQKKKKTKENA